MSMIENTPINKNMASLDSKIAGVWVETGFSKSLPRVQGILRNRYGVRVKQETIERVIGERSTKRWMNRVLAYGRLVDGVEAATLTDEDIREQRMMARKRTAQRNEGSLKGFKDVVRILGWTKAEEKEFMSIPVDQGNGPMLPSKKFLNDVARYYSKVNLDQKTITLKGGSVLRISANIGSIRLDFENQEIDDYKFDMYDALVFVYASQLKAMHAIQTTMPQDHIVVSSETVQAVVERNTKEELTFLRPNPRKTTTVSDMFKGFRSSRVKSIFGTGEVYMSGVIYTTYYQLGWEIIPNGGGCRKTGKKSDRVVEFDGMRFLDPHVGNNNCLFQLIKDELNIKPTKTVCDAIRAEFDMPAGCVVSSETALKIWNAKCEGLLTIHDAARNTQFASRPTDDDDDEADEVLLYLVGGHYYRYIGEKRKTQVCGHCGKRYKLAHSDQACLNRAEFDHKTRDKRFAKLNSRVDRETHPEKLVVFDIESAQIRTDGIPETIEQLHSQAEEILKSDTRFSANMVEKTRQMICELKTFTKNRRSKLREAALELVDKLDRSRKRKQVPVALQWRDLATGERHTVLRRSEDDVDPCEQFLLHYKPLFDENDEKHRKKALDAKAKLKQTENELDKYEQMYRNFQERTEEDIKKREAILKIVEWKKRSIECHKKQVRDLNTKADKKSSDLKLLCAHNGSRYDFHMLKKAANKLNIRWEEENVRGQDIISAIVGRTFKLWDFVQHVPFPLRDIPGAFGLSVTKGDLDFGKIDYTDRMSAGDLKDMIAYLDRDVDVLYEAVPKYLEASVEAMGIDALRYPTLTGCTFRSGLRSASEYGKKNEIGVSIWLPTLEQDIHFRQAAVGGRCEVVQHTFESRQLQGFLNGETSYDDITDWNQSWDCNSLYPTALQRSFPIGEPVECDTYMDGKLGIYEIQMTPNNRLTFPGHLMRNVDGLYGSLEKGKRWMCSPEIEMLTKRLGYRIQVVQGYYWDKASPIFSEYIKDLYNRRKEAKDAGNGVLEQVLKLSMNSFYGRTLLRPNDKVRFTCNTVDQIIAALTEDDGSLRPVYDINFTENGTCYLDVQVKPKDGVRSKVPSHIGAFVLSWSKVIMYDTIYDINMFSKDPRDNLWYMDTDSMWLNSKKLDVIKPYIGGDLGQFKPECGEKAVPINPEEWEGKEMPVIKGKIIYGKWIAKKVYCAAWTMDPRFKCKGSCKMCETQHRIHLKISGKGLPLKELKKDYTPEGLMAVFDAMYWNGAFKKIAFTFKSSRFIKVGPRPNARMVASGAESYDIITIDGVSRTVNNTVKRSRKQIDEETVPVPKGYDELGAPRRYRMARFRRWLCKQWVGSDSELIKLIQGAWLDDPRTIIDANRDWINNLRDSRKAEYSGMVFRKWALKRWLGVQAAKLTVEDIWAEAGQVFKGLPSKVPTRAIQSIIDGSIKKATKRPSLKTVTLPRASIKSKVAEEMRLWENVFREADSKIRQMSFKELPNIDKLRLILEQFDAIKELNPEFKQQVDECKDPKWAPLTLARKYLQKSDKTGAVPVQYRQVRDMGRFYPVDSQSMGALPRQIRGTIARGKYLDVDMVNAHANILLSLCRRIGYECPFIEQYRNEREELIAELIALNPGVTRDFIKAGVIAVIYGGEHDVNTLKPTEWLTGYIQECKELMSWSLNNTEWRRYIERVPASKYNKQGSAMSMILQRYESALLTKMVLYLREVLGPAHRDNIVLCFDGVMIPKIKGIEKHIGEIEKSFLDHGFDVPLKVKPFESLVLPRQSYSHQAFRKWFQENFTDELTTTQMLLALNQEFDNIPSKQEVLQEVKKLIENM